MDEGRAKELLAAEPARTERQLAELAQPRGDAELAHGDQHLADEASDLYEDELVSVASTTSAKSCEPWSGRRRDWPPERTGSLSRAAFLFRTSA